MKKILRTLIELVLLALLAFGLAATAPAAAMIPASFAETAKAIRPAVVNLSVEKSIKVGGMQFEPSGNPFYDRFFERFYEGVPQEYRQSSLGSGVIVDAAKGLVLTNNHVVEKSDKIQAKLADGRTLDAVIVGSDPKTDLAVIRLKEPKGLSAAPLGDSDAIEVGDWVLAVGSPFGLEQTVSQGIVSAKGRVIGAGPYDDFLQTDAAINPGNSGGPLVNLKGEVVGINTAITTRSGGSEGVGFAIPVNMARAVYAELAANGKVTRGWLGVNIQALSPALARHFGLGDEAKGVLIADVLDGGPAAKAGFKAGDVVLDFEGKKVSEPRELQRRVAEAPVGRECAVRVWRGKAALTLKVKIGRMDEKLASDRPAEEDPADRPARLGLSVQPLSDDEREQRGIKEAWGVEVASVTPGSAAALAGLTAGDVILEFDRARVSSPEEFTRLARKLKPGEEAVLRVVRDTRSHYLTLKAPEKQ